MTISLWRSLCLWAFLAIAALPASAQVVVMGQSGLDAFGRSRIQYKKFNWELYQTDNFNVYFYQGGNEMAKNVASYAESDLKRISTLVGYYPYNRITLLLYNSPADMQQSNIGLSYQQYQNGGEGFFLSNKIQIAFPGTQTELKHELSYHIAETILNDMMYGGSLKDVLQSNYLLRLPDWFISGAAAYLAEGWSMNSDDYMRDLIVGGNITKPEKLLARDSRLAGQAIWNYLSERYGINAIQNVMNLTRITRDIEIGISNSVNVSYRTFLRNWVAFYTAQNSEVTDLPFLPEKAIKVSAKYNNPVFLSQPVFNTDASQLAYVKNERGRYAVKVYETRSKNRRTLHRGGHKASDQQPDYQLPQLAWRNKNELTMAMLRHGKLVLRTVTAKGKKLRTVTLPGVDQVLGMSYSADGSTLVMSLVRHAQSDLFVLSGKATQPEQITNDLFDDRQPSFADAAGKQILYSTNRPANLGGEKPGFQEIADNYDIFLLNRDIRPARPMQLTSSISNEYQPYSPDGKTFYYLSEESGIRALYEKPLAGGTAVQRSGILASMGEYSYRPEINQLAFTSHDEGKPGVYFVTGYQLPDSLQLSKTGRQLTLEARMAPAVSDNPRSPVPADTTVKTGNSQQVDINNYQFENEPRQQTSKQRKQGVFTPKTNEPLVLVGPSKYDLRFGVKNFISSFHFDPLVGLGIIMEVGMTDVFEDYRIQGGVFFQTDFRTSNFYGRFMNLKQRYDWGMHYDKKTIFTSIESGGFFRFNKHEIAPQIMYPLNYATTLRFSPSLVHTQWIISDFRTGFSDPDVITDFAGASTELVYDNTNTIDLNQREGFRGKVRLDGFRGFKASAHNFGKISLDARHYLKIHRQLTWANRASYGSFFGPAPKNFLIGGAYNWVGNRTDGNALDNAQYVEDIFYQEFVTPLRGFNYNARSGRQYVLFNSELRFPIVQYFSRKPIYSGFFRNLQLAAFTDIGTAYDGSNPFTTENTFNTQVVGGNGNPFTATVVNYRNPFLWGYGGGIRTTMLGLYMKLDVAWGERDKIVSGPKYYVSIGYDF